jgi:succinoglycan biosynthesis transport protein ExoP
MMEAKHNKKDAFEMPALGLKLTDIYYVLFRQKWIILGCLAVGLLAGIVVFLAQKTLYWSEAKLLVRYVTSTRSVEAVGSQTKSPDYGGENVINSELEILTSHDLCEEVARRVGPEKLLGKGRGSNVVAAAEVVYKGIELNNPHRSNIIRVRFSHGDPAICQIVLGELIEEYFKRHKKIHHTGRNYEGILSVEAQDILNRIRENEEELQKLHRRAGVVSVTESKINLASELARLRQKYFDAEADIADLRAVLGTTPRPRAETNAVEASLPPSKVTEHRVLSGRLEAMRQREFELSSTYTDENPQVVNIRQQIIEQEKKKEALEKEFPKLAELPVIPYTPSSPISPENRPDPRRLSALESKLTIISNQMEVVRKELAVIDGLETSIADIERKLKANNQNYQHVAAGLQAAQFDDKMAEAKMSNIQPVQTPSPAAPNVSQRLKLVVGTFFAFLMAGLGLAFFIEIFVDHTIRKPGEFEAKLKMPLFLSIPRLGLNGHAKMLPFPAPAEKYEAPAEPAGIGVPAVIDLKQTWDADHPLRRYIDGVRDATLTHFGGDPHKPKLVGVTSCGGKAGVTSIAAGLAGALSETGDGNVLLLNLNYEAEAAHPFYRGELACGLADALELDKRANGKVLQNLYVATAGNPDDPATQSLPKQLARIVPKLRVCDYDYIVFDLPPTTPTTMTARLAGMMDLVILVVESEKDTQESVKQASRLLARSKAPVSAVLNKVRDPVPKWLQQGV